MEWRLLATGQHNAFYNMAVDEAVMKAHRRGLVPPTVRFYRWVPPGLSLGYFQKSGEIDRERCRQNNIDIVRRLTGGRAILHDDELTYSIVISEEYEYLSSDILDSYKIISRGIVEGLSRLGIEAEIKPVDRAKKGKIRGFSAACFDAPSWYEVVAGGKKLVGSAQTRKQGIILQHGSIPFSLDVDLLYNLFKISREGVREKMKDKFSRKSTYLSAETEYNLNCEELKDALIAGWEKVFGVELKRGELLPEENRWVEELVADKYRTDEWNFKR